MFVPSVKRAYTKLYARALCHATEDPDKVKRAMANAFGNHAEIKVSETEGVHGNKIIVLETSLESADQIADFIARLDKADLEVVAESAASRIDEHCNLFFRLDKQLAFHEKIKLTAGDDAIAIRLRLKAFPSKTEVAVKVARELVREELNRRGA